MQLQPIKNMEEYLKPTKFCDCNNQEIIEKAKELTNNAENRKEAALNIFYFVRDQIIFMMDESMKASETLKVRHGDCGTKTNLQVALLRAVNIPARYHIASLKKECLKGIIPNIVYKILPEEDITSHPWCECYLSEKWISCDTLFDKPLVEGMYKKGIRTRDEIPNIDWDGENDLNTITTWMIEDKGILPSVDNLFIEAEKESEEIPTELRNSLLNQTKEFIDQIRQL